MRVDHKDSARADRDVIDRDGILVSGLQVMKGLPAAGFENREHR